MTKDQCTQRWLANYSIKQNIIPKLVSNRNGKLTIACSLMNPLTRRLAYQKHKLESGKYLLGYKTCVEEVTIDIDSTIAYIDDFIAIFYKRDYRCAVIKKLLSILEEAKQFKCTITSSSWQTSSQKNRDQSFEST